MSETYINKSSLAIEALRESNGNDSAYPMAFGYAWALMSPKQRLELINFALAKLEEKKGK